MALLSIVFILLFVLESTASAAAIEDRLIDVGGIRLHFRISTGRAPTIVLEAGGGLDALEWTNIQQQLSDATGSAVVSYDRAGFGESDLPKGPFSLEQQVVWLRRGLEKLRVPKQVVLVGHSYGAFLNQLYAKNYAQFTKAIVLIDPNTQAFMDAIGGPEAMPMTISADTPKKTAAALANMHDSLNGTVEALRKAPLSGSIRITVIAAEKRWFPTAEWNDKFDAARKSIVTGFPNRHLIVAERSGHMVAQDRPDVVVSTIGAMVKEVQDTQFASGTAERCATNSQ